MFQAPRARGVFAKFVNEEILGEEGRLVFSLLNAFSAVGYSVQLADNLRQEGLGKYGMFVHSLANLKLTNSAPDDVSDLIYLFDREDRVLGRGAWRKKIQVRFDVFSPYWFAEPILMPYPLHPLLAGADLASQLEKYRPSERKMRIFFSGDTEGYTKNRIFYPKAKLSRSEVINSILKRMGDRSLLVSNEGAFDRFLTSNSYTNKCVLADSGKFRVQSQNWLSALARSDFFLCPPGYVMPMCHNAAEAMATGAIPITNYPEWFDPSLRHLETCVAFDDANDLINKLDDVLAMPSGQIAEMRQRVIDYYETHLNANSFVHRIESSRRRKVVVLLITEQNTARNARRLTRRSILIRGTSAPNRTGWLSFLSRH